MPADTMEKQTASPIAGAPANGSHTPDKPKNASEHRKVRIVTSSKSPVRTFLLKLLRAGVAFNELVTGVCDVTRGVHFHVCDR